MMTVSELKEQAEAYREQAARVKRSASSLKDEADRIRLFRYVRELEEEAAFLEALAAKRDDAHDQP